MSVSWNRILERIEWLLRRFVPVAWAWLIFGREVFLALPAGGG